MALSGEQLRRFLSLEPFPVLLDGKLRWSDDLLAAGQPD